MALTNEQINNIAENCKCGYFQYGDAQGHVRLNFARAIEVACQANDVDFPVLQIIDGYLQTGGRIEKRHGRICLVDKNGEYLAGGDNLKKLLENCIWTFC